MKKILDMREKYGFVFSLFIILLSVLNKESDHKIAVTGHINLNCFEVVNVYLLFSL